MPQEILDPVCRQDGSLAGRAVGKTQLLAELAVKAQFGDLTAVRLLTEAASSVQVQSPATAAQWLRAALRLVPEAAGADQRTAVLFRPAFALGAAGQPRHAARGTPCARRRPARGPRRSGSVLRSPGTPARPLLRGPGTAAGRALRPARPGHGGGRGGQVRARLR